MSKETPKFHATLKRGKRYSLAKRNILFERGKSVPVSAEVKAYLEKNAIFSLKDEAGRVIETRCSFEFVAIEPEPPVRKREGAGAE